MENTDRLQRCLDMLDGAGFQIIEVDYWEAIIIINPSVWPLTDAQDNLVKLGAPMFRLLYPELLDGATEDWVSHVVSEMKRLGLASLAIDRWTVGALI